jgi:hypothetical protein
MQRSRVSRASKKIATAQFFFQVKFVVFCFFEEEIEKNGRLKCDLKFTAH